MQYQLLTEVVRQSYTYYYSTLNKKYRYTYIQNSHNVRVD